MAWKGPRRDIPARAFVNDGSEGLGPDPIDLVASGVTPTVEAVAEAASISRATAYRYFPDLASLLREAMADQLPGPAEALAPVADSTDPVERIAVATDFSRAVV